MSVEDDFEVQGGSKRCFERVRTYGIIGLVSLVLSAGLVLLVEFAENSSADASGSNKYSAFVCHSDLVIEGGRAMDLKGLAVDDATFECPGYMPIKWPNTKHPVQHLRLFRAAQHGWSDERINAFADSLAEYVKQTGAKVLVGTQITCSQMDDEVDWSHVKSLIKKLGREHVLGLAVGNELDQLAFKSGTSMDCVNRIWGGYLLDTIKSRVDDLKALGGYDDLPVTTVFTAGIAYGQNPPNLPFVDTPQVRANSFLAAVVQQQKNFVFTLNFYPYFNPELRMDADNVHCQAAIDTSVCFNQGSCTIMANMQRTRQRIQMLTGRWDSPFWVGEMGWSSPISDTLAVGGGAMSYCGDFSNAQVFEDYYRGFLDWDLHIEGQGGGQPFVGPEIAFYFSMRDSANFGQTEYFGLVAPCGNRECKLQNPVQCATGLELTGRVKMQQKGLTLDDATSDCLDEMLEAWPNSNGETVKLLRTFRATKPGWSDNQARDYIQRIADYAGRNGARVLVGTILSCNEQQDDWDWKYALELAKLLGRSNLLGVAVGNEVDMLYKQGAPQDCVDRIWGGYLLDKIVARHKDLQTHNISTKITSVFTAQIIWDKDNPFMEVPHKVLALSFVNNVIDPKLGLPWVFVINFYPYFDPQIAMDDGGKTCNAAMSVAKCFDQSACLTMANLNRAQQMIGAVKGASLHPLWIGEVGWSSPKADNLDSVSKVKDCAEFSSSGMLRDYYHNFLKWDMTVPNSGAIEYAFYFSMRDSNNFGVNEYFGLSNTCGNMRCKLDGSASLATTALRHVERQGNVTFF